MAGGGARRGTLVIHYGTGHRRPAPRARQPRDEPRSCGSQPAHQSLLDRRLSCRPLPCAIIGRTSCFRTDRRRTPMPPTIESGHESVLLARAVERDVAQILVRELDDEVVATLKEEAKAHDRSLEGEVRAILKDVADRAKRHKEAVAKIEKLRAGFAGRR